MAMSFGESLIASSMETLLLTSVKLGVSCSLKDYIPGCPEAATRPDKRQTRDNEAIVGFNPLDNPEVIAPFLNLDSRSTVWGTEDPNNNTAIFSYSDGADGRQILGTMSGFPTRNENGVMQGNFSIPSLVAKQDVGGQWISVDPTVADEKTVCAFDKAKDLVEKGQLSVVSLNGMLEEIKKAQCYRAALRPQQHLRSLRYPVHNVLALAG